MSKYVKGNCISILNTNYIACITHVDEVNNLYTLDHERDTGIVMPVSWIDANSTLLSSIVTPPSSPRGGKSNRRKTKRRKSNRRKSKRRY